VRLRFRGGNGKSCCLGHKIWEGKRTEIGWRALGFATTLKHLEFFKISSGKCSDDNLDDLRRNNAGEDGDLNGSSSNFAPNPQVVNKRKIIYDKTGTQIRPSTTCHREEDGRSGSSQLRSSFVRCTPKAPDCAREKLVSSARVRHQRRTLGKARLRTSAVYGHTSIGDVSQAQQPYRTRTWRIFSKVQQIGSDTRDNVQKAHGGPICDAWTDMTIRRCTRREFRVRPTSKYFEARLATFSEASSEMDGVVLARRYLSSPGEAYCPPSPSIHPSTSNPLKTLSRSNGQHNIEFSVNTHHGRLHQRGKHPWETSTGVKRRRTNGRSIRRAGRAPGERYRHLGARVDLIKEIIKAYTRDTSSSHNVPSWRCLSSAPHLERSACSGASPRVHLASGRLADTPPRRGACAIQEARRIRRKTK